MPYTAVEKQRDQAIAMRDTLKGHTEVVLDTRKGTHYFMVSDAQGFDYRVDVEFDDPR